MMKKHDTVSSINRDRWRNQAAAIEGSAGSLGGQSEGVATIEQDLERTRNKERDRESVRRAQEALGPLLDAIGNKRRHKRSDWGASLRLTVEQHAGSDLGRTEANVQTKDLSRSGFSFIYRQYLPVGSRITIRVDCVPDAPTLCGEVRRCAHMDGMDHLIGVEFTSIANS